MTRLFQFLRADDVPPEVRANYWNELRFYVLFMLLAACVDTNLNGVVAKKTFGASDALTATIWSIPILANILNVGWGVLLRGQPRVRGMMAVICGIVICVSSIAHTSCNWQPWSGYLFAIQLAATYTLWSALITLRTSLWQVNYPGTHRARIAGRMQMVRLIVVSTVTAGLALLYDWDPTAYQVVYPAAGVLAMLSLLPLARVRVRDEDAELAQVREELKGERERASFRQGVRETAGILRQDPLYRNYMGAQFMLGAANFFTEPILLIVLSEHLDLGYFWTTLILTQTRSAVMVLSTPAWSRYFDRVNIFAFRVRNSGFWCLAYACVAAAMIVLWWWGPAASGIVIGLIILSRLLNGIGGGGGMLAWPLGHLAFAQGHQANLYLGVHVALTGVRGLVMPQLASLAFAAFSYLSFVVSPILALTGHGLYRRLAARSKEVLTQNDSGDEGAK